MARELTAIQQEIIDELALNGITVSGSRTSIRRIWTYVIAFCAWIQERIFDVHKKELEAIITREKPHRLQWYQDMALKFQKGQDLISGTERYANTGLTEMGIEAQKIIKVSSVTEDPNGGLRSKVAKADVNGNLKELDPEELKSFSDYMDKVKDAGVKIIKTSRAADLLRLDLEIWFNPLILNAEGERADGNANTPVQNAINTYLLTLPFNGEFSKTRLVDALQKVEGVVFPVIKSAQAKYGEFSFEDIDEKYIPDAGYLKVENADLLIKWRPYA